MYEAKRRGDRVRVFERAPTELTARRMTLSATIGTGLDRGEFELWYQPKIRLGSGAIVGAEGLVRWHHPDRGLLAPADFLELVTLAGEYHRLTDAVIAQGIGAAATWARAGHELGVSVNLASASFFDDELPDRLRAQLDANGVPARRLTLELTEVDVLDDPARHLAVFEGLERLGVGIAIDDFGTGHSSLVRLRDLPVTEVKLDRSFVARLANDPDDLIIVRAVVELAGALGLGTVAEGVEDEETAAILSAIGCPLAQGYLWAPPMPFDELTRLIEAERPARVHSRDAVLPTVAG